MTKIKFWSFLMLLCFFNETQAQNWTFHAKVDATDRANNDNFGSVAVSGDYAIIGAVNEDEDANGNNPLNNAGSAYIFEIDTNGNWVEVQKAVASDRAIDDAFGGSVAISGNYAVVSAPFEDEDENGLNSLDFAGSAYIFKRDVNNNWNQVQKIVASDRVFAHVFGSSVAIEGDTIIVGAAGENEGLYVFERDINGIWNETQKLVPTETLNNDDYGTSIAIHGDYVIVGATNEDEDENESNFLGAAGAAYIFERDINGDWNQGQKIVASDRGTGDTFGKSVSIFNDFAIIGVHQEDEDSNGSNFQEDAGSAYIFKRDLNGLWSQTQKIVASDRENGDWFGTDVSIADSFAVIGAPREDNDIDGLNFKTNSGSAYIYEKDINGIWNQIKKITSPIREDEDTFGNSVVIDEDYIYIGTPNEDEDEDEANTLLDAGSSYIFKFSGNLNILESGFQKLIKVFPNPTSKELYIKLDRSYESLEVIIMNSLGKILETYDFENSDLINLEFNQASGIYFVRVKSSQGNSINFRIIKD